MAGVRNALLKHKRRHTRFTTKVAACGAPLRPATGKMHKGGRKLRRANKREGFGAAGSLWDAGEQLFALCPPGAQGISQLLAHCHSGGRGAAKRHPCRIAICGLWNTFSAADGRASLRGSCLRRGGRPLGPTWPAHSDNSSSTRAQASRCCGLLIRKRETQ